MNYNNYLKKGDRCVSANKIKQPPYILTINMVVITSPALFILDNYLKNIHNAIKLF